MTPYFEQDGIAIYHGDSRRVLRSLDSSSITLEVCRRFGRGCIGIEINERYCEIAAKHLEQGNLFT